MLDLVPANDRVVELAMAILTVYTENGLEEGLRKNRSKARLMWLVEGWGEEKFRAEIEKELGYALDDAAPEDAFTMDKRDHLGVHPQIQEGLNYIGIHVPTGHLSAEQLFEVARLADVYGTGEIRATVEQNFIIPHIADDKVDAFLAEPILQTLQINPSTLTRSVISCTGARYCNFAQVETKQSYNNELQYKRLQIDLE